MDGVSDKERQLEFYMETTRTTRIVSILVSLVLLGQWDIYGYRQERYSAVSDLAGCGFEEEGYPVVDYESELQTAISTTVLDEMGLRDGFSNNKLLDDFGYGEI
uniref:Ulp1 protease-like n=1 Tax=Oryza sativa subsp. japonica TaxID=39947 RepID=Q67UL4_ORYSJ|nr:ulp1 protease-like [Oryza sativa Japonica Group]